MNKLIIILFIVSFQPSLTEEFSIENLKRAIVLDDTYKVKQMLEKLELTDHEQKELRKFMFNLSYEQGNLPLSQLYDKHFEEVTNSELFKVLYIRVCLNNQSNRDFTNWIWEKIETNDKSVDEQLNDFFNDCLKQSILRSNNYALEWLSQIRKNNKSLEVDAQNKDLIEKKLKKISRMKLLLRGHTETN